MPKYGPRIKDKDKRVIDAFIRGEPLDGDLLSSDGVQLRSHIPLGGGILADRNAAGEISIGDLGGRYDQSVANYIRKHTSDRFLLENKMGDLRRARKIRLNKQGANSDEVYQMLDTCVQALGAELTLNELIQAMDEQTAKENLDWIMTMHDLDEDLEEDMDDF